MRLQTWVVMWTHHGGRFVIDFDDEGEAHRFAATIAEAGRRDVMVTSAEREVDDAEIERARERVWARVTSLVLREAAG